VPFDNLPEAAPLPHAVPCGPAHLDDFEASVLSRLRLQARQHGYHSLTPAEREWYGYLNAGCGAYPTRPIPL